jgi:hypothetical protein
MEDTLMNRLTVVFAGALMLAPMSFSRPADENAKDENNHSLDSRPPRAMSRTSEEETLTGCLEETSLLAKTFPAFVSPFLALLPSQRRLQDYAECNSWLEPWNPRETRGIRKLLG